MSAIFRAGALAVVVAAAGCSDATSPSDAPATRGVVALHAVGSLKGITVNDTAAAGPRISLAAEYDGGGMRLARDTVLTTSSSWGTNRLYVIALGAGTTREVAMPADANAAGAVLAGGFRGATAAVALRSTKRVALVSLTGVDGTSTTELTDVGRCPYDVAVHDGSLWVVDHNAACEASYANLGDARLIRVAASGTSRDTITLTGVRNATSIHVDGELAYVTSIGVADYSAWPAVTFPEPGGVTFVNLRTRQVVGTLRLPQGTNGASASIGRDGLLYVTAYLDPSFAQGVFAIDPGTRSFAGIRQAQGQALRLTRTGGGQAACAAATADEAGRIYCAVNQGASMSTTIVVFDAKTGEEKHAFQTAGTGAVELGLR